MMSRNGDNETAGRVGVLVAHNGIARVVHSYFFEMSNDEYAAFGIKNCEVREYDFDSFC